MISFATKLHILLIMIVIGFGLYMFLLYKEVRIFQEEIDDIKADIAAFKTGTGKTVQTVQTLQSGKCSASQDSQDSSDKQAKDVIDNDVSKQTIVQYQDDDDDDSVTSFEIKNILTNIHCDADADADADVADVVTDANIAKVDAVISQTTQTTQPTSSVASVQVKKEVKPKSLPVDVDLTTLDIDELKLINYDDLRTFLRKRGHNIKGTKPELIKKIQDLQ